MTTPMMLDGAEGPAPFGRWENEVSNDALPYADVLPEGGAPAWISSCRKRCGA